MPSNNPEYMKEWRKQNKLKNPNYEKDRWNKKKEWQKEYLKTEEGKKKRYVTRWKNSGIKSDNWEELVEKYYDATNCELCDVEFIYNNKAKNRRCLDHCHRTGYFRNIICHSCNVKRPHYERLLIEVHLELYRYFNRK